MGYLWLKLNGWGSYGKVSYRFGGYAQKMPVFRGVPYLIITLPPAVRMSYGNTYPVSQRKLEG